MLVGANALAGAGVGGRDGLPVGSSSGNVGDGDAPPLGADVVEEETGAGEGAGESTVVTAVPPVEIGSDTASAYDWGPPSTRLAADTRTVQVPAVTSDAGTTMRSTLLRLSREHDASSPLHSPDLSAREWHERKRRGGVGSVKPVLVLEHCKKL